MTTGTGESRERANAAGTEDVRRDIPSDTFAARLVLVRHHAGRMSIEQAAKACGLNSGNWVRWEDGARPRDRIEVSQQISEALNIDLDWLMFGGALLGSRGRPADRPAGTTRRYSHLSFDRPPATVRPTKTGPKTRSDPHRPIQPVAPGRRAVRVNPVSEADSRYAS